MLLNADNDIKVLCYHFPFVCPLVDLNLGSARRPAGWRNNIIVWHPKTVPCLHGARLASLEIHGARLASHEFYVIAFSIIIDMIIFLGFVFSVLTVSTFVFA